MSGTERLNAALAGRYKIEKQLGQGGMATVYLAHDEKHDRKVAVKVLKPELAAVLGAERFVVEIKTTAALQHPHILPLFDSGTADGFLYYVMPYIEGETLRGKLDRETQFSVEEAVRITTQVADALDYAHRHGVIHRDIKPENILLHDGRPMVADFGIALAVSAAAGGRMTETGLSLGTPHYMSPEQATAEKDITGRSDIYSLASVLFEMLAGQPPHTGGSAQQIIMKIITESAQSVTQHRKSVPRNVAVALTKALEKLPADRFESAAKFGDALLNPSYGSETSPARTRGWPVGLGTSTRWSTAGWVIGVVGITFAALAYTMTRQQAAEHAVARFLNIALPDSAPLALVGTGTLGTGRRALVLSPDGKTLVYAASDHGTDRLHRRALDAFSSGPINGTDGAFFPIISPDGAWVAFFVGSELRKAPIGGGTAVTLATIAESVGAAWSRDGRILVAGREGSVLGWVAESGGPFVEIPNPQSAQRTNPSLLPDGRHALIETAIGLAQGLLGVVDLETGRTAVLTDDGPVPADSLPDVATAIRGSQPEYTDSGHLIYSTTSGLVAVEFDPTTQRVRGRAVELASDVRRGGYGAQYALGMDGTLVYAPGSDADLGVLSWIDRRGAVEGLGFPAQRYGTFALSPDGKRVAALVGSTSGAIEIWVYDLERKSETKVLTRGVPIVPRWWPDGRRVVFTEMSTRPPFARVSVRQLVESAGDRDTLGVNLEITDISQDSQRAVGTRGFGHGAWVFPLTKGQPPVSLDSFPNAWGPDMSPDGRWVAYTSNESGRYEIYVAPVARRGVRQKVSLAGGEEPLWSPRGDALFYRWGQEWYAVASPPPGAATDFGRPRAIFSGPFVNVFERSHEISRDGTRHLVVVGPREQTTTRLNVITNWPTLLRRNVGH